jgi:DHA2 family multidrug resistance protein
MLMMPIAGRITASRADPRMLVSIGFMGTAFMLHQLTIVNLQIDFKTIMYLRMAQVVFMPLIFVPISTLNYVGVPREKNNQVSGLSNFARNIGGSIGTSLLSTFLARQNQIHQTNLAAHTSHGDPNFENWIAGMKALFVSQGYDAATAAQKALALAYRTVQAQANAISFQSSFWIMSLVVACLVPLPFIMRRPKHGERQASAAAH